MQTCGTPTEVKEYILTQVQKWSKDVPGMGGPTSWWLGLETCVYFTEPAGILHIHLQESQTQVKKITWTTDYIYIDDCDVKVLRSVSLMEGRAVITTFFEKMNAKREKREQK